MVASETGETGTAAGCNCGESGETFGMTNGSETSLHNSRNLAGADMFGKSLCVFVT